MVDDFTSENGATRLLPSSHHSDLAPSKEFFEKIAKQLQEKLATFCFLTRWFGMLEVIIKRKILEEV